MVTSYVKQRLQFFVSMFRTGRPVRGILTREQDMAITGKRHPYQFQYKVRITILLLYNVNGSIKNVY